MKSTKLPLEGLILIELDLYQDNRGHFNEYYQEDKFKQVGIECRFVQDNHSFSYPNVLRGLHSQVQKAQGKLVGVTRGTIFDVAVDFRANSPTLGKHYSVELSSENGKLLWIPQGFLHGFCVLGNAPVDVFYKVDSFYDPKDEVGANWADPLLGISWPLEKPIVSAKDQALPPFSEALAQFKKKSARSF